MGNATRCGCRPALVFTEGQRMDFDEMKKIATDTYRIPERITDSILRYVYYGVKPGGFVRFVLCNDLCHAIFCADKDSMDHIHGIVSFVFNELPGNCCGSWDNIAAWLARDWNWNLVGNGLRSE